MVKATLPEMKVNLISKTRRMLILFSLTIFSLSQVLGQVPSWVAGTPSVISTGPLSITMNYGINVDGMVYIVVFNYNNATVYSSGQIKTFALGVPSGTRVAVAAIPVNGTDVNSVFQKVLDVFSTNRLHTIYIVAEGTPGSLQANPLKLTATTLACPPVNILTGFSQTGLCINNGITATFQVAMPDPVSESGILKGTKWFIDWGDDSRDTIWTSTADYETPPLSLRKHNYKSVTSCNYIFSNSIRNPCGETQSIQYVAVVHGRDIPTDGDGMLRIVNNADGSSVIQVCAGVQKVITLRDNSIWNCQNPILPGGIKAIPNTDQRNIEWLYGIDPDNYSQNTITGNVLIGGSLGNAPATSGRITPVPYNSTSLSQEITIPATAQAGQYFRVYLKNWNKCNPGDLDFVSTYVDIVVVSAPPAPQVDSKVYCLDDIKTLTVKNVPSGDILWYNNLMVQVGTGLTYAPVINTTGTFTFYASEKESGGLLCEGPRTAVTITVNPKPAKPTLSGAKKRHICFGVEPPEQYVITAAAAATPARTRFQWFLNGVLLPGRISDTIIIKKPGESGVFTCSSVGIAPSYCLSIPSDTFKVTVHALSDVVPPADQLICQGGTAIFTATTSQIIDNWQWERSLDGGLTFSTVGNSAPYSGFNTNTLTVTNPNMSFSGNWFRVEMKTPNGQGGCRFKSPKALLTIDQVPTANAGGPISLCRASGIDPIYMTGATKTGSVSTIVWSGGEAFGTWTQNNTDPALGYFTPNAGNISGTFTATMTVTGTPVCGSIILTGTRTVTWAQTPLAEAGTNIARCDLAPMAPITMGGAFVTGTYSAQSWSGGTGLGTWSQNANPALATFTPTVSSGSFTATITATGSGACNGTNRTDTRTVAWGQTPSAVPGPDIIKCDATPAAAIFMTGATATGTYTGLAWSGGGILGTWTQNADPALAKFTPAAGANSGAFIATLSLTGTAGCTGQNVSVTRTVSWSRAAIVNAGPDLSICAGATATLSGSFGGGATTASWVGGTGTFNPGRNAMNAVYTPSAGEVTAKTVTLTLQTDDPAGNCPAISDDVTIAIGTLPTAAFLATSGDGCTGIASWFSLGITGGAPPYTFKYKVNTGVVQTRSNYLSGTNIDLGNLAVGTYTYTITEIKDACNNFLPAGSLPAPKTFQIWQNPVANAGSDKGVCVVLFANLTAIPSVGTGSWSVLSGPGTITFNPNANTPAVTATANVAGTYVIRWTETNNICTSTSDITVSYEKAADAGPNQNVCGSLSVTLAGNVPASGTGTWSKVSGPGTVTFFPNDNTPNATATVSAYGSYELKWTIANGSFCNSSDNVNFIFEYGANAGSDLHLCNTMVTTLAANSPVSGTGTWSQVNGPSLATFANPASPTTTATVTAYGTYVYNWKIENGSCYSEDQITVVYNPSGQVNIIGGQVLCHNGATAAITFSSTNGSTVFNWTNSAPGIGLAATGSGDIASFIATNNGTAPVVASITVTPNFSDGVVDCPGPTKTFTITVNPTAQVNQPANLFICKDAASGIISFTTLNTPAGNTTYSWTNDNTAIGLGAGGNGNIPSFVGTNPGIEPITANITVTPLYSNGGVDCTGPSKTFTITVNPKGQIEPIADLTVCNTGTATVNFSTINANGVTSYAWTNSNAAIGLPVSGNGNNISFTATNAETSPVTGTITVTPTFTNGGTSCPGTPEVFVITVNPTAQVNQPANVILCNGAAGAVTFTTVNTNGTPSYSWTNSNTDIGLAATGTGNISFTASNLTNSPILATIVVTPNFNNAGLDCTGSGKTFTFTINPTPALTTSLTPADVCSNTSFNYIPASSTGSTIFSWSRADVAGITPAGSTGNGSINETLRNTTNLPISVTYRYTLTSLSCSSIQDVTVIIKPEPVIVPGQTANICSGVVSNHAIALSNFTNPGDNVTFTWDAPSLNPVSANFTGGSARLSASVVNIQDSFSNTTGADGTATYKITPFRNGCAGVPETIEFTIKSQPVLSVSLNQTVCSNTATGLILDVAPGSVAAGTYLVLSRIIDGLSADPSNATINPLLPVPAGYLANDRYLNISGVPKTVTYRVRPVGDCYGTPEDVVITVNPQPYIIPAQTATVCSGVAIGKEVLLSPANTPAGTLFNWAKPGLSDGSDQGSAGVNVTAEPAGKFHINDAINNYSLIPITATYYITATSPLGCSADPIPVVVTIKPEPVPKPITGRAMICTGETNVIYEVAPAGGSTFHWTVGAGIGTKTFDFNTNAIIINAAASAGSGVMSVYETNSFICDGDPFSKTIDVYLKPAVEVVGGDPVVCANSAHTYSVTSRVGSTYSWTIPGGAAIVGDPSAASVSVVFGNVGGNISVKETSIAGCTTNHTPVNVQVRPLPTAIIMAGSGGTVCPGSSANIFIDFTGTGPFSLVYAINGVAQPAINNAADPYTLPVSAAGTYTIVSVSDATTCSGPGFGSALVSYYPQPTGIISGGATMCGGASATITMTFTGTLPYTFTWTDGTTDFVVPNWGANVYTAAVTPAATKTYTLKSLTDGHACTGTLSGSAVVTINTPPALTIVGTNLTCNNDNSGAVALTIVGSSPFGVAWAGPLGFTANSEDISGLRAGTYNVTVTDTKGCISTGSAVLTEPGAINATLNSTNIFCFGVAEGTITISAPSGGSGNFEYSINGTSGPWQSSGNFINLTPGTYDVRIRDIAAPVCNKVLNGALVLTGPAQLNANVTETDIVCFDAANGSIVLTNPTGGSGTYSYSIATGIWQGSGNFPNLSPGTYTVMIRDAAISSCTRTLATIEITQLNQLTATVSKTNVTCFGSTDGSISITAPAGGSGTWEYSINGGGSWQASGNFPNLTPGSYNVQIRDAVNTACYRVLNNSLTITQPAVLKGTLVSTMVSCFGAGDGMINITNPLGGSGLYQYAIDGTTFTGTSNYAGLLPGSYDVRIRDLNNTGCQIVLNGGLDITEPPALSGTVVKTNITCFGAGDGIIMITNSLGGYGTYEYSISGAGGPYQALNSFTGLSAGTYSVWMRDRIKTTCVKLLNNSVVVIEPAALDADIASTNITCAGANNGTITISNPLGGFGTYQYSINGGGTWVGTGTFLNLSAGPYDVRIRDAASPACELTLNNMLVIIEPTALTATAVKTNVTCFGASNGTITINDIEGGFGSYEFTIDGGSNWQASNSFAGLLPGYYNVRMRDAANPSCMFTINSSLNIAGPAVLNASVAKTNVTCNGSHNGTIIVSGQTGGYGTYQFSINGGTDWFNSGSFTNLAPATYNVQIRDASSPTCIIVLNANVVITEPAALSATLASLNISCNGANDGRIIISGPAGGYGTYEYTINGGALWSGSGNFLNLSQNTYDVRIRDAANPTCELIINNSLFISQPAPLNADLVRTNITCFGAGNGTITISNPTGGYLTYEYTINGGGSWQNTGSFINLGPGNYNVQIRDAANPTCIKVLNNALSIIQLPAVSALLTPTMITCFGANDGIINITAPTGGSGNYEYTINGGTNWSGTSLYTGLTPGLYDVRVRDAVNTVCETILNGSLAITQPSVISATFASTNITCFGANNGTIIISAPTGGYGTYDYTIDGTNWFPTGSFTNLLPATYSVKIRDRACPGCVKVLDPALKIVQPGALAATVNSTNVTCYNANNGTITISGESGGYGTYQYSINGGANWLSAGNFNGLAPGSYNVRIRDGANILCFKILATIVITQPDVLTANLDHTNITCFGANDGTITLSDPDGGYGTYEYSINGGTGWQASGNFTNLLPGFYNILIRDEAQPGCFKSLGSLNITEPGLLGATVNKNDITCKGAGDGKITISMPMGGYGTYEYSIYGGAVGSWQSSVSFTGLSAGTYDVQMRDASHTGCIAVLNAGLVINEPDELLASLARTNVTCNGANDGTISVTGATGGYGSYQYSINGTNWFGSGLFTGLAPAIYTVQMRDAANPGCVAVLGDITITQQSVLNATVTSINVTCAGGGDGSITISGSIGGYGNYEYSINGGGSWEASGTYTGLVPGSYNVRMRDKDHINCVRILNNALNITQPVMLSATVTSTMVTCNSINDGIISITNPLGGSLNYEYSIQGGGAGTWQGSGTFIGLTPGTYNVQIRDQVHPACVIVLNASLIITEPAALDASVSQTNVTCFGTNNGTISITSPIGGYGTFEYSKDGTTWQATGQFTALVPATYNIMIRDKAHPLCAMPLPPVVISQPAVLSASVSSTNVTCKSANDGTITIFNPLGGYGTYGYSANGGTSWQPSGTFTNLAPKTYDVRIRDAANPSCVIVLAPVTITEPDALTAEVASANVTCNGANNGTITITNPQGGYGTYDYSINGGVNWQATGNFTALAPGFYNVQVRDRAYTNCIKVLNSSLLITQPGLLGATVNKNDITCNGAGDGKITISMPMGGYGTYEYSIYGGAVGSWQSSVSFTGLSAGTYDVQMRDASHTGCIAVLNAGLVINEPDELLASLARTNVTCNGANDGTISVTGATGGYGSYQYSINGTNWFGSGLFTGLAPAIYTVQMRDAANPGCVAVLGDITITQQSVLNATVTSINVTCAGGGDGSITISGSIGGYGNYEYSINGGGSWEASGTYTGLVPGSYNVRMRDKDHINCVRILNNALNITQPVMLSATVTSTMVTCNSINDGIISITNPLGGSLNYEYSIQGGGAGTWQGSGTFIGLTPGTYNVQIRDQVHPACVIVLNASLIITEPEALDASVSQTNVTCFGANNGTISITSPIGGYGTFEYSKDGTTWQATGQFTALVPATYNIMIRDKAHPLCAMPLPPVVISQPAVLSASVSSTNVTCKSANDGTITIFNPLGGYGTYGYSANGGTSWQPSGTFTNLAPKTYDVRIRDAANPSCVIVLAPVTITEPDALTAEVASANVTCNGANNGTITITNPQGGYGTYDYSINGGVNWQATGNFTALAPGFYNVQVRDRANPGCVIALNNSLRISEPFILNANISKTNVTCFNAADGTITIIGASGGYGSYEFSISGGASWQSDATFSGLMPAIYNVQIRDASQTGCVIVLNPLISITQPPILNATVTPSMVTCNGATDGMISISNPTGGYGIYQYSITGGSSWQGSGTFINLAPGNYDIMIRDASYPACIITLNPSLEITQPDVLSATIAKSNVTCFGGSDGTITISSPQGGYSTYEYSINGGGSWQSSGTFTALSPGSYSILIRDAKYFNCIKILNNAYIISQPAMLTATVSKTDISCNGSNNGSINITSPSGGSGNYEYSINGGSGWSSSGNFINLLPSAYDVRIRDAANTACSIILYPNLVISEPLTLVMTSTGNITLDCFDDKDGMGTFYGSGGTFPYTFTIVSNTAGATPAASGFNSQTFYNAGAGQVTVSVTDNRGCSAQAVINITQPALLTPGTIGSNQILCQGQNPAQLSETLPANGGQGVYTYQWQYSVTSAGPFITIAGANASQYTPPAGAVSTLYYQRMVSSGICPPVYSNVVEVLVHQLPLATLSGGETICPGQTSKLTVNLPLGTGPFEIDIENYPGLTITGYISGNDINVNPVSTTTYKLLRVRDANGCIVTSQSSNLTGQAKVIVRTLPLITTQPANKTACEFGMVTLGVAASGSDLTYQWYMNDGTGFKAISDVGVYIGSSTSTLSIFGATRTMNGNVFHVIVSGCSVSLTSADATLTVNTPPEIELQPVDSTTCMNSSAAFRVDAIGTAVIYQWQVNKGAGFVDINNDGNISGATTNILTIASAPASFNNNIFRIKLTGTCGAPVYSNFAVLRLLIPPAITLNPVSKEICDGGGPVALSAGGSGQIDSLRWQVNTGGIWSDIYDNSVYGGTTSQQLTLADIPLSFNGNRYRLALKAKCTTVYSTGAIITVNANPVVDFSSSDPINACGGIPIVLDGNPSGGSGIYTQHLWTGDVGPVNNYFIELPTFNPIAAGSYSINYRVRDSKGCYGNDDLTVIVDSPSADFIKSIQSGCTPLTVSFTKDMTGLAKFWWNFDDGSPIDSVNANPTHTFANSNPASIEYFDVTLTVMSPGGCRDSYTSSVMLYPEIDASFTASADTICSGGSLTFLSAPGANKYFWDYGDGQSGYSLKESTVHLFSNLTTLPVTRTVTLTTTSFYNCVDERTFNIVVMPLPLPLFTALPTTQIYNPGGNPVTFTDQTNAGTWAWLWKFGDGTTSSVQNPVHNYTNVGDFNVTLIVGNSICEDSIKHYVYVRPIPPVASFDSIPSGCSPWLISINNTSLNADAPGTTFFWTFGDGSTSTAKNPTYTYFNAGIYRVELTVTGPGGVSTTSRIVSAYPSPLASLKVAPDYVFVNDEAVRCFNLSQGADSYMWDFGDGETSNLKEPFHKYMVEGVYDITLWAYSVNGCSDMYVLSPAVTVEPAGELRFSTVFTPNKEGPIERTDLPTGGTEVDQFFFPPIRETVINYKLQVFNRWGVLIFESRNINIPWNGYYKGKLCPQGVYVWYVEGKYANGKPFRKVGDVTLLH